MRTITICLLLLTLLVIGCAAPAKPVAPATPSTPSASGAPAAQAPTQTGAGPIIDYFYAGPACVVKDHSTTLQWKVTGADTVSIDQGIGTVGPSGNITISCGTMTTYTLTAKAGNLITTDSSTVTTAEPPAAGSLPTVNYFDTSPNAIPPGELITLLWNVSGADSVSIDNGVGKVDPIGRYSLNPVSTTTFNLTASNAAGSALAQVRAIVSQPGLVSSYLPSYTTPHVPQQALVGKEFTILLDAQPTKGYNWVVDYYDPAMVTYVSGEYTPYGRPTRGSDGQQQFVFRALKSGDTRILVSNVDQKVPSNSHRVYYDIHIQTY